MAAFIPNIAKGRLARYADLPNANDALIWVLFTGSETDDNIRDADTLTAVIATVLNEATFTGYSRQTAVGVQVTVDDTNNRVDIDVTTDPSWTPTTVEALTRIALCYDPDTTTGTDADLIPVFVDSIVFTTQANIPFVYVVATGGFAQVS